MVKDKLSSPAGFDCGNGYSKVAYRLLDVALPSIVVPIYDDFKIYTPKKERGSFVKYVDGTRQDLIGQQWVNGYEAKLIQPIAHNRVVDDKNGKVRFGLQLLLGCLSTTQIANDSYIACVTSITNSKVFGKAMSDSISGQHRIIINDEREVTLNIANKCCDEGAGTIYNLVATNAVSDDDTIGLIDIGHGTIICTVYHDNELVDTARSIIPAGVETLVKAISQNVATCKKLYREGDKSLIMRGIENGTFIYGTTGWNFDDVYIVEVQKWAKSFIGAALRNLYQWDGDLKIFACGGGSLLPYITDALVDNGVTLVDDPQKSNVKGLKKIAQDNK